jgi:ketosteroid isomerase-like protein
MATDTTTSDRIAHQLWLMKEGDAAFNRRDVAAMNAAHHPDMIAHVMGSPEPIRGREAHAAAMAGMFRAFPDVKVHNDPYPIQFGDGEWITVVTKTTGTFTGEMELPDGNVIPGTGKAFELDFATTARWEDDQLVEEYVFWDSALMAQQIGLA